MKKVLVIFVIVLMLIILLKIIILNCKLKDYYWEKHFKCHSLVEIVYTLNAIYKQNEK